jgi:uncharacterized membrane protein
MKQTREFVVDAFVGGLLVIGPIYIVVLLLLKAMQSAWVLVGPVASLLPAWFPAQHVLSLLLVLIVCFLVGVAVRSRAGRAIRLEMERAVFERIPGYRLVRSLTQQVAGENRETAWKPALVDFDEALVPAFIIEETADGRFTVFVPSIPTPLAGSVYILSRERVHPVDVPFTQAIRAISQWGSGSKDLVAAMKRRAAGA